MKSKCCDTAFKVHRAVKTVVKTTDICRHGRTLLLQRVLRACLTLRVGLVRRDELARFNVDLMKNK